MAALSDTDRADCFADYMREETTQFAGLLKPDLRAAVDAIDDYCVANAAAMNQAIPQPARAQLTAAQKARLFARVLLKRYAKGA